MLMTQFTYTVDEIEPNGCKITVTRLSDSAVKVFTLASSNSLERVRQFMDSITNELAIDYFPKPRKIKK